MIIENKKGNATKRYQSINEKKLYEVEEKKYSNNL